MIKPNSFVYLAKDISHKNKAVSKNEIGVVESIQNDKATVSLLNKDISIEVDIEIIIPFNPKDVGDAYTHKVCNVCHFLLEIEKFEKNQFGKNNRVVRRPSCRKCRLKIEGTKISSSERKSFDALKPNLVKFTCPVCEKTTIPNLTSKVVLDHDHKTGKPRSWICDSCNTGLGRFKDDISLLENAISYLKKHQ